MTLLFLCYGSSIRSNHTVQGYWLKRNQIGVEGCKEILDALECNSTLTTLDLVQNDLGVEVRPAALHSLSTFYNQTIRLLACIRCQ